MFLWGGLALEEEETVGGGISGGGGGGGEEVDDSPISWGQVQLHSSPLSHSHSSQFTQQPHSSTGPFIGGGILNVLGG